MECGKVAGNVRALTDKRVNVGLTCAGDELKATLAREYAAARAAGKLRDLASKLGLAMDELYNKAHRLGLARQIRRR